MSQDRASTKQMIRQQFGPNASQYATSPVHAKGASLDRLVTLLEPKDHWNALDIATGGGHMAFALAPKVKAVLSTDLLEEMLDVARSGAAERDLSNVAFQIADAEKLPFDDNQFDAVTCRIAPHHFANPGLFVSEVARVLKPGGLFGLVDNMVNDEASEFVNGWEAKRDPSHVRALSVEEWVELIVGAGMTLKHVETLAKRMNFEAWANNMNVPDPVRVELLAELVEASPVAHEYLRPEFGEPGDQSAAAFYLTEGVLVAQA